MLFVTFRLADSLPAEVQQQLIFETERAEQALNLITDEGERRRQAYRDQKRLFARWDEALGNTTAGSHWLRQPKIAQLLVDSLHYRHGRVYNLDTFCIMRVYDLILKKVWSESTAEITAPTANGTANTSG